MPVVNPVRRLGRAWVRGGRPRFTTSYGRDVVERCGSTEAIGSGGTAPRQPIAMSYRRSRNSETALRAVRCVMAFSRSGPPGVGAPPRTPLGERQRARQYDPVPQTWLKLALGGRETPEGQLGRFRLPPGRRGYQRSGTLGLKSTRRAKDPVALTRNSHRGPEWLVDDEAA